MSDKLIAAVIGVVLLVTGFCAGVTYYSPESDGFYCARRDTKTAECTWYVKIRSGSNKG